MRRKRNYWDKESSFSAALEFTNKRDFKREYAGAYEYLRKNKLFDESCAHMKTLINLNKIKWTYEKCRECAQNFECVYPACRWSAPAMASGYKGPHW